MEFRHIPVMLAEVVDGLDIKPDGIYVDCTIGGGGHSEKILEKLTTGTLIGFDRDVEAINHCKQKFAGHKNVKLFYANFNDAPKVLQENGINKVDGILIDLGVSSYQLDNADRGFSYMHNGRLDMRMDENSALTAEQVINTYSQSQLERIFFEYGEEEFSKKIAKKIANQRKIEPISTTFCLRNLVESCLPKKVIFKRGGASKKVFQALRIEVNGELDHLRQTLDCLFDMLKSGGKMAVLSFHSLEDRIVKNVFKEKATGCICPPKTPICICGHKQTGKIITKGQTASVQEIESNPRSRSAKLRIIQKL